MPPLPVVVAGALIGLAGVSFGYGWGVAVAGLAAALFILRGVYEVITEVLLIHGTHGRRAQAAGRRHLPAP